MQIPVDKNPNNADAQHTYSALMGIAFGGLVSGFSLAAADPQSMTASIPAFLLSTAAALSAALSKGDRHKWNSFGVGALAGASLSVLAHHMVDDMRGAANASFVPQENIEMHSVMPGDIPENAPQGNPRYQHRPFRDKQDDPSKNDDAEPADRKRTIKEICESSSTITHPTNCI